MMSKSFNVQNLKDNIIEESLNEIFVFSCDDFRFLFANKGALQNLGYTLEELKKITPVDIKPQYSFDEFSRYVNKILSGEVTKLSFKTVHQRKDGTFYNALIDLQVMDEGKNKFFVAMVLDVTQHEIENLEKEVKLVLQNKQVEVINKLLKLNSLYEVPLKEKLTQGMHYLFEVPWLKFASKGGVFLVNDGVLDLTVSVKMGPKIETMCDKVKSGQCLCGRAFETREIIHASCVDERHENRFEGISPHGHYNVPIISDGVVLGVMVFYLPHGHKRNDAEVEFLGSCAEVFAQLIRTNDFQEKLIKEKQRAQKAENAKSAFLANMSHEIRTPMNGVIGMAELLMDEPISKEVREKVKIIKSSGTSLLEIINDILDISKIEAGKLDLEEVDFVLTDILTELSDIFSIISTKKDISLEVIVDDSVPKNLLGDPLKLRQIIQNLINNAVKFTEKGHISIEVTNIASEAEKPLLKFTVEDTGIGISKNNIGRLFKKFSQADESTNRRFGGTGLGLSICKSLVELMGGEIGVTSVEGKGTTFTFTLPLQESKKTKVLSQPKNNLDVDIPKNLHVLLVDDNGLNIKVAERFLSKIGYTYDVANNGQEALDAATSNQYDFVLMDCHMPVMDGYQATRSIIRQLGDSRPYIIALTASSLSEDVQKCRDSGMDGFLSKPITKASLYEAICEYGKSLDNKKSA